MPPKLKMITTSTCSIGAAEALSQSVSARESIYTQPQTSDNSVKKRTIIFAPSPSIPLVNNLQWDYPQESYKYMMSKKKQSFELSRVIQIESLPLSLHMVCCSQVQKILKSSDTIIDLIKGR